MSTKISATSVYVAAVRAVGARDPDPAVRNPDYLAERFLGDHDVFLAVVVPVDRAGVEENGFLGVDIREARRNRRLALFVLGPGTLLPALLIAVAAAILLRLSAPVRERFAPGRQLLWPRCR